MDLGIYLICYVLSYLSARFGIYWLSGILLMGAAVYLYWRDYYESGRVLHLRALFSLFWIGGQGISCLKLSHLQGPWKLETWLCFLVAYLGFWIAFEVLSRRNGAAHRGFIRIRRQNGMDTGLFHGIVAITTVSLACFIFEAVTLGFVPLFSIGVPHAYSTFHLTGIHYFTVSCVLVPALSVIYYRMERGRSSKRALVVIGMNVIALMIPVLCVSRFQLILAVFIAVFVYLLMEERINIFYLVGIGVTLVALYIVLTFARSHDVEYLNGIFEMKNSKMPIFITQPYMYVANNYDNFNCLVEELPGHSFGLRMLMPLFTFTGLKFAFPQLVNFPIFTTRQELTTLTLFYDAYYDFGILGVLLLSALLGAGAYWLMKLLNNLKNPVGFMFYAQFAVYLMLCFFTTWFSNPTTWFYLVITGMVYLYCSYRR